LPAEAMAAPRTVRRRLTRADDASFFDDGFVVLRGFLEEAEVAEVRRAVDSALAAPLPPGCERPHNTLVPLRWNDTIVDRLLSSRHRVSRLARALGADDLRWISGYVSVKDRNSAALWWHQDWWCWDHPVTYRRAAPQAAVLTYLSPTSATTGALRVLPGSHRRSVPLHAALPEAHARQGADPSDDHPAMSDHVGQLTVAARPGDAVAADYRLLHGTHPNRGGTRRDCLLLTFTPTWKELPGEVRAHLIRHPAQPTAEERPRRRSWQATLLPHFDGTPRDLALNRVPPPHFVTAP
jgi:hypothetical protein